MKREKQLLVRISDADKERIQAKMEEAGIRNMSAYIRKMCIDGYFITLQIPELTECAKLLRYDLAMSLTKGNHAFIVCTHVDKHHIHSHIVIAFIKGLAILNDKQDKKSDGSP